MGLFDDVAKPSHYQFGEFQAVDVIVAVAATIPDSVEAVHSSHLLKYALRWPRKGGLKDLYKARWWLDRLIDGVERRTSAVKWPPPSDYDPANFPFCHGELDKVCGIGDVPKKVHSAAPAAYRYVKFSDGSSYLYPGERGRACRRGRRGRVRQSDNAIVCHTLHTTGVNAHDMPHETPWRLP